MSNFRERAMQAFRDRKDAAEPQGPQLDLDRPTAEAIFDQVANNARSELNRSLLALFVSGVAGGLAMGLTGIATAIAAALLGESGPARFVRDMLYPVGFITVILGRAQLFTENTLYPVALVLAEKRHYLATLRLWCTVLPANICGALLFALLAARTHALKPEFHDSLVHLGAKIAATGSDPWTVFWSGVFGGWIIAMMAWLVSGSHSITGSVALIWLLTYVVGLGEFAHCIASSGEILTAVLAHAVPWTAYWKWLAPAVSGNVCGGVLLVTLLEYGQTKAMA